MQCRYVCISEHKYAVHSGTFGSMSDGRWAMRYLDLYMYIGTYLAAQEVESACVRWKFQDPGTAGMQDVNWVDTDGHVTRTMMNGQRIAAFVPFVRHRVEPSCNVLSFFVSFHAAKGMAPARLATHDSGAAIAHLRRRTQPFLHDVGCLSGRHLPTYKVTTREGLTVAFA